MSMGNGLERLNADLTSEIKRVCEKHRVQATQYQVAVKMPDGEYIVLDSGDIE